MCGEQFFLINFASAFSNHPRVCGEQLAPTIDGQFLDGSPPRVRGTVEALRGRPVPRRITPACAGNSARVDGHAAVL